MRLRVHIQLASRLAATSQHLIVIILFCRRMLSARSRAEKCQHRHIPTPTKIGQSRGRRGGVSVSCRRLGNGGAGGPCQHREGNAGLGAGCNQVEHLIILLDARYYHLKSQNCKGILNQTLRDAAQVCQFIPKQVPLN